MMRSLYLAAACAASVFALTAEAAPAFSAPEIKVGRNLQAIASVILPQPAPAEGLPLTITSDDPARVLFAAPDKAGSQPPSRLRSGPNRRSAPSFGLTG